MIKKAASLLLSTLIASTFAQKKSALYPSIYMYTPTHPTTDNSTYANTDYIKDTWLHIDWNNIFWTNSTILGSVTHEMIVIQETNYITLDMWDQTIINVTAVNPGLSAISKDMPTGNLGGQPLTWRVDAPNPGSGQVLIIDLGQTMPVGANYGIQIFYSTAPTALALTWLTPAQTVGKVYPYMFSQSEDISGRSFIPM
jgi:leukotriene-A4 hydrolase